MPRVEYAGVHEFPPDREHDCVHEYARAPDPDHAHADHDHDRGPDRDHDCESDGFSPPRIMQAFMKLIPNAASPLTTTLFPTTTSARSITVAIVPTNTSPTMGTTPAATTTANTAATSTVNSRTSLSVCRRS